MAEGSRAAWDRLYARHGMQFGGSGDLGPFVEILTKDMLVLDAGCGEGKTTEALSRMAEVVGCDFSREGLLSLRTAKDRDTVLNLVQCNLETLPFAQEKFDAVACVHSLSHLPLDARKRASDQLAGVLRHGGYLFVEGFGREDLRYGNGDEVEEASFRRGNGIMTHYFREGEVQGLFPGMRLLSETALSRRVAYGPTVGKRSLVRVLLQRPE